MGGAMAKPTVFISHRHADARVAKIVGDFLDERSSHNARVYLSSSADFSGPGAGEHLVSALKRELAESDLVVLVFTSEAEGWSWCMWECGVATDPKDDIPSKVVVLQCGDAAPAPYVDHVRVDVRNLESLTGFVRKLLATKEYFPQHERELTGYDEGDARLREFAEQLHGELGAALAELRAPEVEERSASTHLCVELDRETVAELRSAVGPSSVVDLLGERAVIVRRQGANALFGRHLESNTPLGRLQAAAEPAVVGAGKSRWFEALAEQIVAVVRGEYPIVPWAPFSVETGKAVIPYVAGSRSVPATGALQVLVYFVPMSPRPVPVTERMISPQQMFCKNLADTPGASIRIVDLILEMKQDRRSRVPLLGEEGRPKFIVHQSMIDEYVRDLALAGTVNVHDVTVHDLLNDPARAETFHTTLAVVGPEADMDQALAAMNAVPGCQDVFVTEDGTKETPVVGWLTNTMFTR